MAYERDLSAPLATLEAEFKRWRKSEIDAFELSAAIHRFHKGPARELFGKYLEDNLEWSVALAIHRGLISEGEAGAEALAALERHLAFLRTQGA
jgi:hypothetical protein